MSLVKLNENREYKHKHNNRLCHCCDTLQDGEEDLHIYTVSGRGYGSIFDGSNFSIQLCDECKQLIKNEWFNEEVSLTNGYCEDYKYEEDIKSFINTFPIENQEYIWNGSDSYMAMDRQEWIDMQLGTLPDEKYEEYGMDSPRQIKAYEENFPTCNNPVNVIYDDESKGCICPFGASGDYGQITDVNISDECYNCENYKPREETIKEMSRYEYELYEQCINGIHAYRKLEKLVSENEL